MSPIRSPLAAIGWMLAAVATFSLMDAGMKQLAAHYPPLQVTMLRGAASLPFVLVWVLATAGARSIVPVRWGLHLLRGVLGMVMIGCFVFALKRMPLSTAYSIYFVAPLLVAALSVPLLGEKVGPRRWTAIAIGLVGVVVVLRPGVGGIISFPGLMVLLAATAYAIAAVTVSLLTRTDTPQSMVVWFLAILAIGAGLAAIPGWVPLRLEHAGLVLGMVNLLLATALLSLIYRGPLEESLGPGLGFGLVGSAVLALVLALGSSFRGMYAGTQDASAAIIGLSAASISGALVGAAAFDTVLA